MRSRPRTRSAAAGLLALLLPVTAFGDDAPAGEAVTGIDVPHLVADHVLVFVLQPKRTLDSKFFKALPEAARKEGFRESGIEAKDVVRMVWALRAPTAEQIKAAREGNRDGANGDGPSFYFEFAKPPERKPVLEAAEAEQSKQHGDHEYFLKDEFSAVGFPTDKSIVIGPEGEVKRVLDVGQASGKGLLAERLRAADREFDLLLVCDLTGREELVKLLGELGKQNLPPQMAPQLELAAKVKSLVVVADLDGDTLVKADIEAREGDIDEVKARLEGLVQLLRTLYQFSARPELQRSPLPFKEQAVAVADDFVGNLKVSAEGNTATLTLARPKGLDDLLKTAKPFLEQATGGAEGESEESGTDE